MNFLLFLLIYESLAQWIDPHDMNSNLKSKHLIKDNFKSINNDVQIKSQCNNYNSDLYISRLIGLLLNHSNLIKNDLNYIGHLTLHLNQYNYNFLKEFSKNTNKPTLNDLRIITSILDEACEKTNFEKYSDIILTYQEILFKTLFNFETGILTCLLVVLYIVYKLTQAKCSLTSISMYLLFIAYWIDWILTYMQLRNQQEIETLTKLKAHDGTLSPECKIENLSWLKYFLYMTINKDECKEFHLLMYQNHNYLITPLKVFSHQFGVILVQPLEYLGHGFGLFHKALFKNLPWGIGFILYPLVIISCGIVLIILLLFITKTPIKLNLLHILKIELGQSLNKQLELSQRTLMENLKYIESLNEKTDEKICSYNRRYEITTVEKCENEKIEDIHDMKNKNTEE